VHGDDAARLITVLGGESALVFGTSGGAQIALNLAARYPGLVSQVVAHEPPSALMLDDPSEAIAVGQELYQLYRRDGIGAAMQKFFSDNGLDSAPPPSTPEEAETTERIGANFGYWLAHGMLPLTLYRPNIEALRDSGTQVTVALGTQSQGQVIHSIGQALAARLSVAPASFPGDHAGFASQPVDFANVLRSVLNLG
jgi:pimeloyl-ACP methyl ester carboxylesterase